MARFQPVRWVASSRDDLREFPSDVRRDVGYALHFAQMGDKHPTAKPLKGFGSAGVLEIVVRHEGSAFRLVYTVEFPNVVYVPHAFQKKSKKGIKTPKQEIELIRTRLNWAEQDYLAKHGERG